MGTMLYAQGVFINRSFDSLNLSDPAARAGRASTPTRMPGPTSSKRTRSGPTASSCAPLAWPIACVRSTKPAHVLPVKARADRPMSRARWGRSACGSSRGAEWDGTRRRTTSANRRRRSLDGGVDLFILETFRDLNEIRAAIGAVRSICALPIVAQMTIEDDGNTLDGTPPEQFAPALQESGADVIGLNCSIGPAHMLETLERMTAATGGESVRATQRRPPSRHRRADDLSDVTRVHGVLREAFRRAAGPSCRRVLRHDARSHRPNQSCAVESWTAGAGRTAGHARWSRRCARRRHRRRRRCCRSRRRSLLSVAPSPTGDGSG